MTRSRSSGYYEKRANQRLKALGARRKFKPIERRQAIQKEPLRIVIQIILEVRNGIEKT